MIPEHFIKNPLSNANTIWRSCGRLSVTRPQRRSGFVLHPCLAVLFLRRKSCFFKTCIVCNGLRNSMKHPHLKSAFMNIEHFNTNRLSAMKTTWQEWNMRQSVIKVRRANRFWDLEGIHFYGERYLFFILFKKTVYNFFWAQHNLRPCSRMLPFVSTGLKKVLFFKF